MKILITGAAGFVGSHLASYFEHNTNHKLLLVDDFSRGKQLYLEYLKVKTPCRNYDLSNPIFAYKVTKNVDVVFHCAAYIGGVQHLHGSPYNELNGLQKNLAIDKSVFDACLKNKVKQIIYTSSVSVYNTDYQYSYNAKFKEEDAESMTFSPEGGYGLAKYIAEKQLEYLSELGIKVGIARIFKSYGECDDYSDETGQVVNTLMRRAVNYPKEKFVIWGDGSAERCFLYIDDLVEALVKLQKYDDNLLIVNIGHTKSTSIKELAKKIIEIVGKDINIEYNLAKPVGPYSRIPDISKAEKLLGWKPKTSLEEGLKKVYEWFEWLKIL